jgi:hypothetical protein
MSGGERECQSELVIRSRRGRLSQAEGLSLQAHLASCATCRLSRRVLSDFGEMSAVDHRDDVRIERLASLARGWTKGRVRLRHPVARRFRVRFRFLAFAAGVALLAGSASAAIWLRHQPAPLAAVPSEPQPVVQPAPARRALATRTAPVPAETGSPMAPEAPAPLPARRHDLRALAEGARPTPALLLRRAGDAQRSGDRPAALALYRQLRRDHPTSPEALLATVPLGKLLLSRDPSGSLLEFDVYLRSASAGALLPEALYGRARALEALGDAGRERQTWERLLAAFPDSAYAPIGRRRLAELR